MSKKRPNSFIDTPHSCQGYQGIGWTAINVPSALGCPLQLRKIDWSMAIEVSLAGNTVLLTEAQVDEFWRMVGKLRE